MKYNLFEEIILAKDIPEKNLKKGDVATIVEYYHIPEGEDGYSLEVFNTIGDTLAVITVEESAIEPVIEDAVFCVRSLAA
ncbi:MAG: DUF4926 domain-containing protein [Desulfamplus sp.]